METILNELKENADLSYKEFHKKLIPTVDENTLLGVRSPICQKIAKKYANTDTGMRFLSSLPHKYYDENVVHAFMLGKLKCSFEKLQARIVAFLPYVDNWGVCDGLCAHLKNFFKKPEEVYDFVLSCIDLSVYDGMSRTPSPTEKTYAVRFGLVCLLNYYIDSEHIEDILKICKSVKSDEYYVNMALAWLISFCLIKEYDATLPLIEEKSLDKWVHNKSIQKATESYRIDKDRKTYLRSLKK